MKRQKISPGYTIGALEAMTRHLNTDPSTKASDCTACPRKRVLTRPLHAPPKGSRDGVELELCPECWRSFIAWLRTRGEQ